MFLGVSLKPLNACLFAPALSHDMGLVWLHAQVPFLSAALVTNDMHTCLHFASVVYVLNLLEFHYNWRSEDFEVLGEVPLAEFWSLRLRLQLPP